MAITDFSSLKAGIADNMARSDLTSALDDFVAFSTQYFNFGGDNLADPPLRCREMEAVTDITPASGVCALPSDYLQYRRVVEKLATRRPLKYITPDAAEVLYPSRYAGLATSFTIIGSSLYTFPLASNDVELTYYQKIPALSDVNTSNWLLAAHPQVYLRAGMVMACHYIKDFQQAEVNRGLLRALVAGLNGSNSMANYANAGMRIAGPVA